MAEVVDWSPVDDDNDSAPPVGAPEGMMPAAVNNTMRAMMGSLRRMYDKIVSAETVLPYLPTAGGTVDGNVAINGTGGLALADIQLRQISGALEVYHAASGGVASRGPAAGYAYGDRNQTSATWTWYANGGISYLYNAGSGNVLNVTNLGRMALAGAIDTPQHLISGTLFAERSGNAHIVCDAGGEPALTLYGPAGGNTSYYQAVQHFIQTNTGGGIASFSSGLVAVTGDITASNITVSGNIAAAADISASGNIGVSGNINAGTVTANQLTSNAGIVGNTVHANTTLSAGTSVAAPTIAASGNMSALNMSTSASISAGTWINAPQYRLNGVPMAFDTLFDQIRDLQDRVAALEAH